MGNNATLVIFTDGLSDIRSDAQGFVAGLWNAIISVQQHRIPESISAGWHGNVAQVVDFHHADAASVVLVGGNRGIELGLVLDISGCPSERTMAIEAIGAIMKKHDINISDLRTRAEKRK